MLLCTIRCCRKLIVIFMSMQKQCRSVQSLCGVETRLKAGIPRIEFSVPPARTVTVQDNILKVFSLPALSGLIEFAPLIPTNAV